jgi:3'-phosphoadenosine 5'-phosphosulfate sulfotransferase (PAPS reductase)/FAD synthetase
MNTANLAIEQISWFDDIPRQRHPKEIDLLPLDSYSTIVTSFSGGKDSMACVLKLLDMGVPKEKIILWHQNVDGCWNDPNFVDWPITHAYVTAFAEALGLKLEFQWRVGGFRKELLKQNQMSADVQYTYGDDIITLPTLKAKISTRMKYPAPSADLKTRWCSSSCKIDPATKVLTNHPDYRFTDKPILFVSGERREESSNRAKYAETQLHPANSGRRTVHWWRMVIDDTEDKIWQRIEKNMVMPHPAYLLGWGRVSCQFCVFSSNSHLAILRELNPDLFYEHVRIEKELQYTVHRTLTLEQRADLGSTDRLPKDPRVQDWIRMAFGKEFKAEDIFVKDWQLPAGAFSGSAGGPN